MKIPTTLALAALALTGCTTMLPSAHTEGPWVGRCYETTYIPILDMGAYTAAQIMDGWKCIDRQEGDPVNTGTRAEVVAAYRAKAEANLKAHLAAKAAKKAGTPVPVVPAAAAEPTWATGE